MRRVFIFLLFLFSGQLLFSQVNKRPPFYQYEKDHWVDSIYHSMSLDEKIGQLIMVTAFPRQGEKHYQEIIRWIKEQKIGGFMTMQGTPAKQVQMINQLQAAASVPLLVSIDGEWGLAMRMDSCIHYPYAMALGAITNDSLIYRLGMDIARQCKRVGINIDFAPVSDVNNNPNNPIIGYRSFGDNPRNVARKVIAYSLGMQSQNVLPTIKHFPGHGDTDMDSHLSLPVISHSRARLDSIELYPFREAIKQGVAGLMSAHLSIPTLDNTGVPASLSKPILTGLLRKELGFEGLVVTDAMNMKGIDAQVKEGSADVMAIAAGNDVMEFVLDPVKSIAAIKDGIEKGQISIDDINRKCYKVLMVKRWMGLNRYKPASLRNLNEDLNSSAYKMTLRNIVQKSLTVIQNRNELIPLRRLDTLKIAAVSLGSERINTFQNSLNRYKSVAYFNIGKDATPQQIESTMTQLKKFNLVIVGLNNLGVRATSKYNLSDVQAELTKRIAAQNKSIFVVFGNPYVLNYLDGIEKATGIVMAYQENNEALDLAGQLIFGAFGAEGRLPVKLEKFPKAKMIQTASLNRFKYTLPEEVGLDSLTLKKRIDSLVNRGLKYKAFPGCQIFLAKDGKVFFDQAYGYHTYDEDRLVTPDDLYDFASLTKIMAPLPAIMKLYDQKKISPSKKMSDYWPSWKGSNKQNILVADVLSHQARLEAWIPFWQQTVDRNGRFKPGIFSTDSSEVYSLHIGKNLFLRNSYPDSIYKTIRNSPLLKSKKYVYSDLGFIVFPKVIERLSKENYEHFLRENFYDRIGASTLVYRPYLYFPMDRIVPTENDTFFRHQLLHGFVHDEGSAMVGGLSGNAGLFGTVNDAAKMMQMYLNYGQYGGDRYLSESTLKDWTSRHFLQNGNRRAYGFDKPVPNNYLKNVFDSYPAPEVSDASFGHSGFTGTFAWADPKSGILYLFFSNRVYPTRENNKLTQLNLRILLQDAVYQSFNGNTYHEPEMLLAGSKASKIAQSSKSGKVSKSSSKAKKHKTRALARHGKKSNVNKSKI